jgi:cephalosporin-C deacetylase-like acetyl esterase
MGVAALKLQPKFAKKTYHATVHVTRVEDWCVEAESEEEARELLVSGEGYRMGIGNCMNIEVERVED